MGTDSRMLPFEEQCVLWPVCVTRSVDKQWPFLAALFGMKKFNSHQRRAFFSSAIPDLK